jgi:hypothetical protein
LSADPIPGLDEDIVITSYNKIFDKSRVGFIVNECVGVGIINIKGISKCRIKS